MGKYFGTDGFRGEANCVLNVHHALEIGRYLGSREGLRAARVAIGKDTRRSSYMLEYALAAGLVSSGADAYLLHVTTTPSVSYTVRTEGFDLGIMISASHNPYYDNGIKLIGRDGEKLSEEMTEKIENYLDGAGPSLSPATGGRIGRTVDHFAARNRYVGYLLSISKHSYKGIKIGLDCANGSTWMIARNVFESLGGEVHVIGTEPNGFNINLDCGSTNINALRRLVTERGLDIGFAFDGDGDRCIAVCENGDVLDGDSIMYICARRMRDGGELYHNTVVSTVMSNMGLRAALAECGIDSISCDVGDRFVYETMKKGSFSLGGEESGHIIFSKYATTGDGLVTAVKLMEAYIESTRPASRLADGFARYPHLALSIPVRDRDAVAKSAELVAARERAEAVVGGKGRVMVRRSGTESVIRVMAECSSHDACREAAELVASEIRRIDAELHGARE